MTCKKPRILIVDDELGPRESLRMILRDEYETVTASCGKEAVDRLDNDDFDLAILDIRMPDMNGTDLLKIVKGKAPLTEVVMITAYASVDTAMKALRSGALDYLIKPFEISAVRDTVARGLNKRAEYHSINLLIEELKETKKTLEDKIETTTLSMNSHYQETINSLVAAVDAKDSYTKGHQERVARLAVLIGETLLLEEDVLKIIEQAATLHDIGKIGIPEYILRKEGELDKSEYDLIKKHPAIGSDILAPVQFLKEAVPLVLYHHERFDGCGYPEGLRGKKIPLGARVIALADSIDAMLWDRPYAASKTPEEVIKELERVSGAQFDPEIVEEVLRNELIFGISAR